MCMYVYKYSVHIYLLCMIKVSGVLVVNGECYITLGKLIGLLFLFCPTSSLLFFFFFKSPKYKDELARPAMGTIFLVGIDACQHRIGNLGYPSCPIVIV